MEGTDGGGPPWGTAGRPPGGVRSPYRVSIRVLATRVADDSLIEP